MADKVIITSGRDQDMLNWLIRKQGVTKAAIEAAAKKIEMRGQRPYPSNIVKFFGFKVADIDVGF